MCDDRRRIDLASIDERAISTLQILEGRPFGSNRNTSVPSRHRRMSGPPGPNAERCPDPTQPILFTFTGYAYTNLGRATFVQSHCEATDNSSFGRGQEAITFENGDKLFGTYEGDTIVSPTTATDFQVIVDGTYRNTGGTGALARAHGRGISAGHVDVRFGTARIAVSGSL